jgi:hypothetical protein
VLTVGHVFGFAAVQDRLTAFITSLKSGKDPIAGYLNAAYDKVSQVGVAALADIKGVWDDALGVIGSISIDKEPKGWY